VRVDPFALKGMKGQRNPLKIVPTMTQKMRFRYEHIKRGSFEGEMRSSAK
jgi:hypothetical protein